MPAKPQSWKKIIDQRRKENFVGRGDQLRVFSDNFVGDVPDCMVFAVTGEGGVGKSALLTQYEAIARSASINANVIICDDRHLSPASAMGYIAGELAKIGAVHKGFDERYKKYRDMRQEIEGDAKAPRSWVNMLAYGVSDLTIKSLRKAPGVGVLFEYADEKAAGEAFAELVNYGINRWGNKDEVQLLREPEIILAPLFLELLNDACARQPLVLMFDVFERTCETLSPWLMALFDFEYGEFTTRLTFVVSGRDPLEQHWTELAGALCRVPLEPFTLEETRLYLSNQEIMDERLVAQIHADTGGLPVLVELLAATKPQPNMPLPDISKDAVERFLQWTPQEERRQAALLAAVPRQFNRDILDAALGSDATAMFNWLTAQSYIRTNTERGCFYHEKVRELMLRHLRHTTPNNLAATHARLREFFEKAQGQLDLPQRAVYDSETWRSLECERVYHAVSEQPDRDIVIVVNAFLHAFRWRWGFAEQIAQVCHQGGQETNTPMAAEMAETLSTIYGAYDQGNYEIGIKKLEALETRGDLSEMARCETNALCGLMYHLLGHFERALRFFDQALMLDPNYLWAIASRGETYRLMEKYELALADFDRAIALDEKWAWDIASRGQTYRAMEKYEQALADFDRAIALDEKMAWAIVERGETYRLMEKYELALADFDRAIALDEKMAWAIASRGETYRLMEKYELALADFDRAIALDEKYAWAIASRGETYRLMGKYELALADFDRAIALDEKWAWAIASRGQTRQAMGKYELALADFDRAIGLDEKYAWAIASRGETYRLMGRYEAALADLDRAIALDDTDAWAIARRGDTYRQLGKYEQALADFDQAISLDEELSWAMVRRGQLYLQMERHDQALTEFNRAIALAATPSRLYKRALARRAIGQPTGAIADLAQAIYWAEVTEAESPEDWSNTLDLALYYLVGGDHASASDRYGAAIDAEISEWQAREALWDLDYYLCVFPADEAARKMRGRLQHYVEERFPKGD